MPRFIPAAVLLTALVVRIDHSGDYSPNPPSARVFPKTLLKYGQVRTDNYHWFRQNDNPDVVAYLKSENAYAEMMMRHTAGLQAKLVNEFRARLKQTGISKPYQQDGYYYYTRFSADQDYPIYCRKKGSLAALEEVVVNVNQIASGLDFASVEPPLVSPNSQIAAYAVDTAGRGSCSMYYKNLKTGQLFRDAIRDVTDNLVWANDNQTSFYVQQHPATLRPYRVYRHILKTDPHQDVLVYEEKNEAFSCYIFKSASRKYLFIDSRGTLSNEYRYLDADNPAGSWRVLAFRHPNHEYSVDHWKDSFYIRTNLGSPNFRVMKASMDKTAVEHWKEVIPNRDDVLLEDFSLLSVGLVAQERKNGLIRLHVVPWSGEAQHYVDFGQPDYFAYPASCGRLEERSFCYVYTSLNTPSSLYRYDLATHAKTLMQRNEVLGGFDSSNYNVERIFATAKDGVRIPISMVYRKGLRKNGASPVLLEAYGAYGDNMDPAFDSFLISLLDRGFIYGIAHVRGGEELGRKWYEDGRLLKKKNSFTDFIACAEYLVRQRYADPKRVFAEGASAGGTLIAAVANMRSDLFRGVVAEVPWVDVLTTLLDDTIPGVTTEYEEWGNPADKQYYNYIRSYSPYDQIKRQRYPNMLVTSALHDSQVPYWEPAKWVAKLRATKTDDNRLVLKTDMAAGHNGASGRDRQYKDIAFKYAFLLDLANITR